MRILFVTHRFLPGYVAGIEIYSALMAQELARRGHQVQIFTGDPSAKAAYATEWNGLPVRAVPWGVRPWPRVVSTYLASFINRTAEHAFDEACRDFRPDVVHIHHLMGLSSRLPAMARRHGARVVITLHDYWFVCSNTWLFRWTRDRCPGPGRGYYCGGCALHRLRRGPQPLVMLLVAPIFAARTRVLRQALFQADQLVAPSQAVADRFVEQGISAARLKVLPHGVTTQATDPAPQRTSASGVRFVYVGSLTPPKGIHIAIQAFNRLAVGDTQFHIHGNLTEDPDYLSELRALATHPGIEFKGLLLHDQLEETLRSAHMLLLPSLWDEPYSIIIDEALHTGLPVLVSDRGAPKERIQPGINGLIAAAGDVEDWHRQMQYVADNRHVLDRLRNGARSLKRASDHAHDLEAIYSLRD